jgi:hypothetical protein
MRVHSCGVIMAQMAHGEARPQAVVWAPQVSVEVSVGYPGADHHSAATCTSRSDPPDVALRPPGVARENSI